MTEQDLKLGESIDILEKAGAKVQLVEDTDELRIIGAYEAFIRRKEKEALYQLKNNGFICERVVNGNMPKYFYHGTPKKNLDSIRKNGLLSEVEGRNYLISYDCVCLTLNPESAIEWAQRANFNNFAILKIDSSRLDPNLLELDPNMQVYDNTAPIDSDEFDEYDAEFNRRIQEIDFDDVPSYTAFAYNGDIPPEAISIEYESKDVEVDIFNKVSKIMKNREWNTIPKIWNDIKDIRAHHGTLGLYVLNKMNYDLELNELLELPAKFLNMNVSGKTVLERITEFFQYNYPEKVAPTLKKFCNELSNENIEYLWSLYTKPQQNKTFSIMKTLPHEILEIGKPYISKKFHKELGI
jgi:hypothetical protein